MSGEELYGLYMDSMDEQNIIVDDWNSLDEPDRLAWNDMATKLALRSAK